MKSLQDHVSGSIKKILASNKASNALGAKRRKPDSIGTLSSEAMLDKSLLAKLLRSERRMNFEQIEAIAKALEVDALSLFKPKA